MFELSDLPLGGCMNGYCMRGRTVLISFTCGRCGKTHVEPYSKQAKSAEGNLQEFKPPEGWQDDTLYLPLLCDTCKKEFDEFMKPGSTRAKKTCDNCANKRTHPDSDINGACDNCVQAVYPDGSESEPSQWRAKNGEKNNY
jgi:hypothetical protein